MENDFCNNCKDTTFSLKSQGKKYSEVRIMQ